ncbi:MAG: radical SAM protein [Pirellulales bacterium]|nr:radical SAM protein [Pirellulales bacterium]
MKNHIFGPVPSHRLGRSLGVDLVPFKTCSFDCLYCQLGRTTCKTVERKEWVQLEDVIFQLADKLSCKPDYITLSGSGEPTLFSRLDELIERIKEITDVPVAVLTNGSLLWKEEVQRQLAEADLVMPSLDAGNSATFQLVNRPHESLRFEQVLAGLISFRRRFRGRYWLEILLIDGVTTTKAELAALAECVARIGPDRLLLGTVTRPPAEACAVAVPSARLAELAAAFSPPGEILPDLPEPSLASLGKTSREDILALLARRPCTVEDLAIGLGIHKIEAIKRIESLMADGLIKDVSGGDRPVYRPSAARFGH